MQNPNWPTFIQGIALIFIGVGCYAGAYFIHDANLSAYICATGSMVVGVAAHRIGVNFEQSDGKSKGPTQ